MVIARIIKVHYTKHYDLDFCGQFKRVEPSHSCDMLSHQQAVKAPFSIFAPHTAVLCAGTSTRGVPTELKTR